jgi:hypothetical protein
MLTLVDEIMIICEGERTGSGGSRCTGSNGISASLALAAQLPADELSNDTDLQS